MKKIVLVAMAALGTFTLTGCDFIQNFTDPEKSYSLSDYKALLAERDFKGHDYTTAKVEGTTKALNKDAEEKETIVYTWSQETNYWIPDEEHPTQDFELFLLSKKTILEEIKTIETASDVYTFYARKSSYRILLSETQDGQTTKFEWKYDSKGLIYEVNAEIKDSKELTNGYAHIKITYSK